MTMLLQSTALYVGQGRKKPHVRHGRDNRACLGVIAVLYASFHPHYYYGISKSIPVVIPRKWHVSFTDNSL
jgi:hypothetical protein